jgi:hypothetical protein
LLKIVSKLLKIVFQWNYIFERIKNMITSSELEQSLFQFYGTDRWYIFEPTGQLLLTDGTKFFADKAEAYWLMTEMGYEYLKLKDAEPFISVVVTNEETDADRLATIEFTDGNYNVLKTRKISNFDLPLGVWKFYIENNVIHLPSEH